MTASGLPHSEILGSKVVCTSPRLIAAYHVLHRLLVPRHPPCALSSLTKKHSREAQLHCLNGTSVFKELGSRFEAPGGRVARGSSRSAARGRVAPCGNRETTLTDDKIALFPARPVNIL
jgi:hypothetical protein